VENKFGSVNRTILVTVTPTPSATKPLISTTLTNPTSHREGSLHGTAPLSLANQSSNLPVTSQNNPRRLLDFDDKVSTSVPVRTDIENVDEVATIDDLLIVHQPVSSESSGSSSDHIPHVLVGVSVLCVITVAAIGCACFIARRSKVKQHEIRSGQLSNPLYHDTIELMPLVERYVPTDDQWPVRRIHRDRWVNVFYLLLLVYTEIGG